MGPEVNVSYVDEDDFVEGGILQTLHAIIKGIMQISKNIKENTYEENPCTCPIRIHISTR